MRSQRWPRESIRRGPRSGQPLERRNTPPYTPAEPQTSLRIEDRWEFVVQSALMEAVETTVKETMARMVSKVNNLFAYRPAPVFVAPPPPVEPYLLPVVSVALDPVVDEVLVLRLKVARLQHLLETTRCNAEYAARQARDALDAERQRRLEIQRLHDTCLEDFMAIADATRKTFGVEIEVTRQAVPSSWFYRPQSTVRFIGPERPKRPAGHRAILLDEPIYGDTV